MNQEILESIIKAIVSEMDAQGLTKTQAAEIIGVSPNHFSKKLKGRHAFSDDEIDKLANWVKIEINREKYRVDYWWVPEKRLIHEWNENNNCICNAYIAFSHENTKPPAFILYIYRHIWGGVGRLFYEARDNANYLEQGIVLCNMDTEQFTLTGETQDRKTIFYRVFEFATERMGFYNGYCTERSKSSILTYPTLLRLHPREKKNRAMRQLTDFPFYLMDTFTKDTQPDKATTDALKELSKKHLDCLAKF